MPSKIYRATETPIVFRESGGDVVLSLAVSGTGLGIGAGRISARYDRGAGSVAQSHEVRAVIQAATSGFAVGDAIEIWLFQSDGTYMDGTLGTSDATMGSDKRRNGLLIGAVIADTTSSATDIVATFMDVQITSRYYSIGVWNASATRSLNGTANSSRVIVTPMPPEAQ
jgi:hypothetical protein